MEDAAILVFAPHQDDEVLHCAGVLRKAASEGKRICVCYATNGEYEDESLAIVRYKESMSALRTLGVPETAVLFLGYADTGMPPEESFFSRLLHGSPELTVQSRWGRKETWLPEGWQEYRMQKDGVHSPYTKEAVMRDLTELITEFRPDEIYVTSPSDLHGDHAALGIMVTQAAKAAQNFAQVFYYLVHTGHEASWPPRDGDVFTEPEDCAAMGLCWESRESRPLPTGFTVQDKKELMYIFASQDPHAYDDYLLSFAKKEEIFFRL